LNAQTVLFQTVKVDVPAVTIEKTEQCALFVFHSTKLEMYVLVKTD